MLGMAYRHPPGIETFPLGSENWDLKFSISLVLLECLEHRARGYFELEVSC